MNLQDKIVKLRKSHALSQEELAQRLGVSRQAVSKWESGQSLPDVDKIVAMSNLFGVTTDYLLKNAEHECAEIQHGAYDNAFDDTPSERSVPAEEIKKALAEKYREAKLITMAVFFFILSPLCLISLLAIADAGIIKTAFALAIGLFVLFFFVTLGVGLCIYSSFLIAQYKETLKAIPESPDAKELYQSENKNFETRRRLSYILGVSLTIISPLPIIFYAIFNGFESTSPGKEYIYFPLCMSFLFISVAIGVALLTNAGMRDEALKLLNSKKSDRKKGPVDEIIDLYWTALPFIYLLISFLTGRWDVTWIIWPLAPIIPGIISAITKRKQ